MVKSLQKLTSYPYSGHSALLGEKTYNWQQTGYVLELFAKKVQGAREQYAQFVAQGLEPGRRPEPGCGAQPCNLLGSA